MFVKMKDELIALYYSLSKRCNKVQHKSLEGILTAKYQNKNTLQDFGENTYSKNSKYKNFFLVFFRLSYM